MWPLLPQKPASERRRRRKKRLRLNETKRKETKQRAKGFCAQAAQQLFRANPSDSSSSIAARRSPLEGKRRRAGERRACEPARICMPVCCWKNKTLVIIQQMTCCSSSSPSSYSSAAALPGACSERPPARRRFKGSVIYLAKFTAGQANHSRRSQARTGKPLAS